MKTSARGPLLYVVTIAMGLAVMYLLLQLVLGAVATFFLVKGISWMLSGVGTA